MDMAATDPSRDPLMIDNAPTHSGLAVRDRRPSSGVLAALVLVFVSSLASCAKPDDRPSLVLLISLDTLRPSHLGVYGYDRATSPNLDAFGNAATVFEHAWSTSSWTLPSHASLFLSQYPHVHGIFGRDHTIPARAELLTEQLQAASYRTGGFYAVSYLSEGRGFGRGFDHYESTRPPAQRSHAARVTEVGLQWLDEAPADQPNFLFLHYFDAHAPYGRGTKVSLEACRLDGAEDSMSYRAISERVALNYLRSEGLDPLELGWSDKGPRASRIDATLRASGRQREAAELRDHIQLNKGVGPAEQDCLLELYDQGVRELDRQLGLLFDELKARQIFEDALIIIVSDHGETLYEREGFRAHGRYVYDFLTRAVFMVKVPGQTLGARIAKVPVSLVDVWPTIAEAVGVSTGPEQQGRSLWGLLVGKDSGPGGVVLTENINPRKAAQALISWPYKLIVHRRSGKIELFDLAADPGETRDLSARPAGSPRAAQVRAAAARRGRTRRRGPRRESSDLGRDRRAAGAWLHPMTCRAAPGG